MWCDAVQRTLLRSRRLGSAAAVAALLMVLTLLAPGARADILAQATRVGPAPAAQKLDLVFPLAADYSGLRRFALAITTFGSPAYAQYESIPQLASRFGASRRTRERVVRFLRAAGATGVRVDATGLFVDANLRVGTAEKLFGTSLASFRTAHGARFTEPGAPVTLPTALQGLVTTVVGLDTQPIADAPTFEHGITSAGARGRVLARAAQGSTQAPSGYLCSNSATPCAGTHTGCSGAAGSGGFTPNEYLTAYDYEAPPITGARAGAGERVALIEIDGFNPSDIRTFAKCFGLRLPSITAFAANSNVTSALPPGGESTLDLEVLDAVAPGLKEIDVYESDASSADVLQALTAPLQNTGYKPDVISASLGLCEGDTLQAVGRKGVAASEAALEEAAASGISFLASSGDDGSADCIGNNGPIGPLAVNYPASSWWATGVGGTNFTLSAANQITSQVVWNDGSESAGSAGGGGLSNLFNRPSYQAGFVTQDDRAVPDVSMLADIAPGYAIFCTAPGQDECDDAGWTTVGGTSAATPLLAGGFALIDELLRSAGEQDLGLANPLLYKLGGEQYATPSALTTPVFDDVTQGSNDVGPFLKSLDFTPLGCCTAGVGFDEASGLGSVNVAAFAGQALALLPKIVQITMKVPGGQRPLQAKRMVTRVTCSGSCLMGSFASVYAGRKSLFTAFSNLYTLTAVATKTVVIGFSSGQLKAIKNALAHHQNVVAFLRSAVVDPAGNIERQTVPISLQIRS